MKPSHAVLSLLVASALVLAGCKESEPTTSSGPEAAAVPAQTSGSIPEAVLSQVELSYWEQATSAAPNGPVRVKVGVSNHSDYPLPVTNPPMYQVMATWHDQKSYALIGEPAYGPLAFSIPGKETGAAEMNIVAPSNPGTYLLKLQLADAAGESLEGKGVKALMYNIQVR